MRSSKSVVEIVDIFNVCQLCDLRDLVVNARKEIAAVLDSGLKPTAETLCRKRTVSSDWATSLDVICDVKESVNCKRVCSCTIQIVLII